MGWKTIYKITEKDFQNMYNAGQYNWGDHSVFSIIYAESEIFGAGKWSQQNSPVMLSPRLPHRPGTKTRITVKVFTIWDPGATGSVNAGVVFYKDGETCKDYKGDDLHGMKVSLLEPLSLTFGEFHTLTVEQENNTITYYADGKFLNSVSLESPLNTLAIGVYFSDVKITSTNAFIGYLVTDVTVEYYDVWEDIMNQITSMMNMMIWIMIAIVGISLFVRLFKKE